MRGAWIIAAVLVVGGTAADPARAGVYNTSEPWPWPSPSHQFQLDEAAYRAAAVSEKDSLGARYRRRVEELEGEEARGTLSLEDRSNLGAYYIRLGKPDKAIRVLEPKAREGNFMLLTNLATAHELNGSADLAVRYQEQALAAWPTMHAGWDTVMLQFYRKAEQLQLKLLTLRQERSRQPEQAAHLQLDNLFPRVRFGGPGGKYEVGGISSAQAAEIPSDATSLVMQLLLWTPFDDGLHWLLGELLNASGDVIGAAAMMKMVVEKAPDALNPKWNVNIPDELRQHYKAVAVAAAAKEKLVQAVLGLSDPYLNQKLLCAVAPRGMGLGAGDLIQEATWPAIAIATQPPPPKAEAQTTPPASASTTWLPDWKQVGVGFVAGAVVALLLGFQIRQARLSKG
jgi:hypothetical protein